MIEEIISHNIDDYRGTIFIEASYNTNDNSKIIDDGNSKLITLDSQRQDVQAKKNKTDLISFSYFIYWNSNVQNP